jgi:mono/diheme cytochrome c family protein
MRSNVSLVICLAITPLFAQHDASNEGKPKNPAMGNPKAIAAGQKLFADSCAGCHGVKAEGGPPPSRFDDAGPRSPRSEGLSSNR